jgi:excisionase family DNA binding protein|tara:strand:- start:4375 stop:4635 length:261 start_codon:yes stop_codon:yes gene_type:complete
MAEPFVPIEDVAKHFAVSISTIRAWLRQGHIPKDTYVKLGNTYRFKLPAVEAALTNKAKEEEEEEGTHNVPTETQLEFDLDADRDV